MEALRERLAEATDPASQARLRRIIAQQERNARNRQAWDEDRDLPEHQDQGQKRKRDDGKERPREQIFADIESDLREEEARQKREAELRRSAEARRQSEAEKRRIEAERRAKLKEKLRREHERREREQRERESRSNSTYPPPPRVLQPAAVIPLQSITDWRQHVALAFTNYSTMQIFPSPPAAPCGKPECHLTRELRTLEACKCNIQACIRRAGVVSKAQLKSERLKWHPDRFAACPEDRREQFAKMGREVFVVVDGKFQGEEGGRCAGFDGR